MSTANYNEAYYTERHEWFKDRPLARIPAFRELRNMVSAKNGERILELGSGIGYVLNFILGDSKGQGYGIDISEYAVKRAAQLYPSFQFSHGDAVKTQFESGYFDKVFCFHVIEHIEDYEGMLKEMHRLVRINGEIVVGTEMLDSINTKIFNAFIGDPTHIKEFKKIELVELVSKYFEVLEIRTASCVGRFPQWINVFFHILLKGEVLVRARKIQT